MSLKIAKDYFDNNYSDQIDLFQLSEDGEFYERTIAENDLELSFDDDLDGKRWFLFVEVKVDGQLYSIFDRSLRPSTFNSTHNLLSLEIVLSHTMAPTSNGFQLSDSTRIKFVEESLDFQCRYARQVVSSLSLV